MRVELVDKFSDFRNLPKLSWVIIVSVKSDVDPFAVSFGNLN